MAIKFMNEEHKNRYYEILARMGNADEYHKAAAYLLLSLDIDCYKHVAYQFSLDSKVIVIDTDGQSNTSRFYVKQQNDGLEKVLTGKGEMPRAEKTRYANLDVISATAAINNAALIFGGFSEKKQSEIADKIITSNSDYDCLF